MKELRCALALALVGLVSATPYGYGVKGGAAGAAKGDASAEIISGVIGLPLSIPRAAGYSGTYSNSASSSFSSSSASSSSGSFSFNGSGTSGLAGFENSAKGTGGCATSGCQAGSKDINGPLTVGGSGANGLQGYNAANAAAGAGAGAIAGIGYNDKGDTTPCTSGDCSKQPFEISAKIDTAEKSEADALSEVSSNENTSYKNEPSSLASSSSDYGSNNKCASGKCGPNSETGTPSTDNYSDAKCTSGQCGSAPGAGASADAYANNKCPTGNCGPSSNETPTGPNGSDNKCTLGNCGFVSQPGEASSSSGSTSKCSTSPCGTPSENYEPGSTCGSGDCSSTASQPTAPHINFDLNSKPTVHPEIPSTSYGHPVAVSPSIDFNNKCTAGYCGPDTSGGPSSTTYGPYDIPVTGSKSTYNSNEKASNYDKSAGESISTKSDCSVGNCGPSTLLNAKPAYKAPVTNFYPGIGKPNDAPSNYGDNPTFSSGSIIGYNKPSIHLTTPKLQENINHRPGPSSYYFPGSFSNTFPADKPCSAGNCDFMQPSTPFANSNSFSTNNVGTKNPNPLWSSESSGPPCSSPNCAFNTHAQNHHPQIPGYAPAPGYEVPAGPAGPGRPAACTLGNCATYPSPSNSGYGVVTGSTAPSSSYGQSTSHISSGPEGIAGSPYSPHNTGSSPVGSKYPSFSHTGAPSTVPALSTTSSCKTPNCASYPSPTPPPSSPIGATQSVPSFIGILKPSGTESSDENLPPYTGGFGGPSGILKPYETVVPSKPSNSYNKPPVSTNVHTPSGINSNNQFPVSTGAYQPAAPNSENKPTSATGTIVPIACASEICGSPSNQPAQNVPTHSSASQTSHGSTIPSSATQATAGAEATAEAIAYTGGFGGPPGILKPYDDGKIGSQGVNKYPSNNFNYYPHGTSSTGFGGSYGTGYKKHEIGSPSAVEGNVGVGTSSVAQANALAGASSGGRESTGFSNHGGHFGSNIHEHKGSSGCNGGCGFGTDGSYGRGSSFGLSSGLGFSKIGHIGGLSSGLSTSGSTARSLAGAVNGATAFGTSGSFASSAATAHASAGAGVKGGYYG